MLILLVYLIIFLLPLGQLGRISLSTGVNLYLHDIAVVVLLLTGASILISKRQSVTLPSLGKPILVFSAATVVSLVSALFSHPARDVLIGSLYLWRWLAYAGVYILLEQRKLISAQAKKSIRLTLIAVGFIAAVLGLIQYILLPDTRFLLGLNWDEHYYRLIGTWFDPGFTGIMFVLSILLIVVNHRQQVANFKKISISHVLLVLSFVALMLTYSRASYISLLVGLAAVSFLRKNSKVLFVGIFSVLITAVLLPRPGGEGVKLERTQSVVNRIQNTSQAIQIMRLKPIFGVGFNLLRYEKRNLGILGSDWRRSHSGAGLDNSFLFVLATTGVIGILSYLWLLKSQLSLSFKHNPVAFASLIAVIVHSGFNNTLFYPWVMLWLWVLVGSTITKENR